MRVFIPLSDEMLESGMFPGEPVVYQPGQALLSQQKTVSAPAQSSSIINESPTPTPNSDAIPALSSSTYLAGATLG